MNNTTAATGETPPPADDYSQYPEYTASVWIWKICPPVLIILGTIGNTLSIVVLTRKSMIKSTVSVYLIVLSVVDILVLYTGLLRQWLRVVIEIDIRLLSEPSCKIHIWMVYFTLDFSVWLLVSVTVERFVSVWFPHKVKRYCTKLTAFITIGIICAILLALTSHYLYGLGDVIVTSEGVTTIERCTSLWENYGHFELRVWPWIDLCVFSLLPLTVLILANISIIFRVIASHRSTRRVNPSVNAATSAQAGAQKTSSMTIMLLVLNVVFFVCTLPISVYLIGEPYWLVNITPHEDAVLLLIWAIVNILMYTNNAINFLLYCISGSRFRETLKNIFLRNSQQRLRRNSMTMRTNVAVIARGDIPATSNQAYNGNESSLQVPKTTTNAAGNN